MRMSIFSDRHDIPYVRPTDLYRSGLPFVRAITRVWFLRFWTKPSHEIHRNSTALSRQSSSPIIQRITFHEASLPKRRRLQGLRWK
jgi:hypothetical protein